MAITFIESKKENPHFKKYTELLFEFGIHDIFLKYNYMPLMAANEIISSFAENKLFKQADNLSHIHPMYGIKKFKDINFDEYHENTYTTYAGQRIFFLATAHNDFFKHDNFMIHIDDPEIRELLEPKVKAIKSCLKKSNLMKSKISEEYSKSIEGSRALAKNALGLVKKRLLNIMGYAYHEVGGNICSDGRSSMVYQHNNNYKLARVNINTSDISIEIFAEEPEVAAQIQNALADIIELVDLHRMYKSMAALRGE